MHGTRRSKLTRALANSTTSSPKPTLTSREGVALRCEALRQPCVLVSLPAAAVGHPHVGRQEFCTAPLGSASFFSALPTRDGCALVGAGWSALPGSGPSAAGRLRLVLDRPPFHLRPNSAFTAHVAGLSELVPASLVARLEGVSALGTDGAVRSIADGAGGRPCSPTLTSTATAHQRTPHPPPAPASAGRAGCGGR